MREYFSLFFAFIKIGVMTFGGGYAMLPVLERELIKKRGWVTMDEVMDYYAIAQVTPGMIAVNVSTFVGCKRKGAVGGIIATLGFILIPVCLLIVIGLFLQNFANYPVVKHAFAGVRVAVGALILDTIIKMAKKGLMDIISVGLLIVTFVLFVFFNVSPVVLVIACALLGLVLYHPKKNQQ
jgi:chromate transporter